MDSLLVGAVRRLDAYHRADAIAVGAHAHRPDADGVVRGAPDILEEIRRTAIRGQQDVGRAVVVNVGVGGATGDERPGESELLAYLLETRVAFAVRALVVEHQ